MNNIHYFQCPYCTKYECGHAKRIPKTIGKYRIKIVDSYLHFTCAKCGREFRVEYIDKVYLWSKMTRKQREEFKQEKGRKKIDGKKI